MGFRLHTCNVKTIPERRWPKLIQIVYFVVVFFIILTDAKVSDSGKNTEENDIIFDDTFNDDIKDKLVEISSILDHENPENYNNENDNEFNEKNLQKISNTIIRNDNTENWVIQGIKRVRRELKRFWSDSVTKEEQPSKVRKDLNNIKTKKLKNRRDKEFSKQKMSQNFEMNSGKDKLQKAKEKQKKQRKLEKHLKMLASYRSKRNFNDETLHDDEDNEVPGSGIGSSDEKMFRVKFTVREIWMAELADKTSEGFRNLSNSINTALEYLIGTVFLNTEERVFANVIQISSTNDPFKVLVTADLIAKHGMSGSLLDKEIRYNLEHYQAIGDISAEFDNNYQFRVLEDTITYENATGWNYTSVENCHDLQFTCRNGDCIDLYDHCDGVRDCKDNSDEEDCPSKEVYPYSSTSSSSTSDNFIISEGSSGDGSDDIIFSQSDNNTTTTTTKTTPSTDQQWGGTVSGIKCRGDDTFKCPGSSVEICDVQRCDDIHDCPNGEDEKNCGECEINEFACDETRCIPQSKFCDGANDCTDRTDELDCTTTEECQPGFFQCNNGQCIPEILRCNHEYDCPDSEDEENCPTACGSAEYLCSDGNTCINNDQVCDGINDCILNDDEESCKTACLYGKWQCDDGTCIDKKLRCNGNIDCPEDISDERNCNNIEIHNRINNVRYSKCLEKEFRCSDGICIANYKCCNGIDDCDDQSDELNCPYETNYDYDESIREMDTSKCAIDEFECDNSMCISQEFRCNGYPDCVDETDEINCPSFGESDCNEDEFQCDHNHCIPIESRCNGIRNCFDGTDEQKCPQCQPESYHCNNDECIPDRYRCDDSYDCIDGSDEIGCENHNKKSCVEGHWQCENLQCINREFLCDDYEDCLDGSDESNKTCSKEVPRGITADDCSYNEFFCDDSCHERSIVCNGFVDCLDRKDEENCGDIYQPNINTSYDYNTKKYPCPELACPGNGKCYRHSEKCDFIRDCDDGFDENDCPCKDNEFSCYDHQYCIKMTLRCDGYYDCKDFSDEQYCFGCRENEFKCNDGTCVDRAAECNGRNDCSDGSDEANCITNQCQSYQWTCSNGQCINIYDKCDGKPDCSDYSDERSCAETDSIDDGCSPNEFRCENGPCIPSELRCNGRVECPFDTSDELDCGLISSRPSMDAQLNLKTYPSEQTIKERYIREGREVVFRCRDEGPLRAPVRWTRPEGRPLPPGFSDKNGRLEIPNIRTQDTGEYICEAFGYPSNTRGQSVTVHLTVEPYNPLLDRPPTACTYNEATCMNGECIGKSQICDGIPHCTDGSDEHSCSHGRECNPDQFMCKNKKCVDRVWRCDGENDCGDNSDEESCDPNPTGSPCRYDEYQCRSGQCIPKSFHCDGTNDCQDGTDEIGCASPVVVQPPVPRVDLQIGDILNISCRAIGVPVPLVVWRLNWGHVPRQCKTTNNDGYGTLICDKMQIRDSGAYSCEIINTKGRIFVTPDTIVTVNGNEGLCPSGFFNKAASRKEDCINCFCFGVTNQCKSADLFVYELPPPATSQKVIDVVIPQGSYGDYLINSNVTGHDLITLRHGIQFRASNIPYSKDIAYLSLPSDYQGNLLKSYGGFLKYEIQYIGNGIANNAPDVILKGNGYTLIYHAIPKIQANVKNSILVQFIPGVWKKTDGHLASREDLMMVLANIENILLKLQYIDTTEREVELIHITMDSSAFNDHGLGSASLVEECICPPGYTGYSCEKCLPGYNRQKSGTWLGRCIEDNIEPCQFGTYGDPNRGIPCRPCPCPLVNHENNFARSCSLGSDNEVICHCQRGYTGRRCEQCESGYEGNPLIPGGHCSEPTLIYCDKYGTKLTLPDGTCECKDHTTGLYCDKCAINSFHLNDFSYTGCIECFCMGVTKQCSSSSWYRDIIQTRFNGIRQEHGFSLISDYEAPSTSDFHIIQNQNELRFAGRAEDNEVHYWSLPSKFLGDKVTSYGGYLNYTIRYNPMPGGLMSKNVAPDVVIKSDNGIEILHYRKDEVYPSGLQSYSIPIIEDEWQRSDGRIINREHLLMTLADINAIYIKATYTTVTEEAAISHVSLDIANKANIGTKRAYEVEECSCPIGHIGLSCEDCAPGYKRSTEGLYLGICELCECNSHSNECDPETGHCMNCRDNTSGEKCELCAPGFIGNATQGTTRDCMPDNIGEQTRCQHCDFRGYINCDNNGLCRCKEKVIGYRCDQCRDGSFNLQETNPEGCTECFCSGVSRTCSSSYYSREQIPIFIFEDKPALSNYEGDIQIDHGFDIDTATNYVSYNFNEYNTYFWRLPPRFLGDQVKSYGGNLQFTLENDGYGDYIQDQDVILRGNGITLVWSRPQATVNDETVIVRLHESERWLRLERMGLQAATHSDFIMVLSNLDQILLRATLKSPTTRTGLSNVVLDTAIETRIPGHTLAHEVEICQCPTGYVGSSCESCAPLHYRDVTDRRGYFGTCKPCPCDNSESCNMQANGEIKCHCKSGYSGSQCQYGDNEKPPPQLQPDATQTTPEVTISVTVTSPLIHIIEPGQSLTLYCSGEVIATRIPILIKWYKLNGRLPELSHSDRGRLYLPNLQEFDSGIYVCQGRHGSEIAEQKVTVNIGPIANIPQAPQVTISPPYIDVDEFAPADAFCHVVGNPTPTITWSRVGDKLPPTAITDGNYIRFNSIRRSDEGAYRCFAINSEGSGDSLLQVYIRPNIIPNTKMNVIIEPPSYHGRIGDEIRLNCLAQSNDNVSYKWLKDNVGIYGDNIYVNNNILMVNGATLRDSGNYICQVTNIRSGETIVSTAPVTIDTLSGPPQIKPLKDENMIVQGEDFSINCDASGTPYPKIKWTKLHDSFDSNVQQNGNILRIINANPSNRGVYVCIAENESGSDQASTIIDVEPRERPMIEIHPKEAQTIRIGESASLNCRAIAGIPEPTLVWERRDRKPLSSRIREEYRGTISLNEVTLDDAGEYECRAENIAGRVSATAVLNIYQPPEITITPDGNEIELTEHDELKLLCIATGHPLPVVTWNDTIPLPKNTDIYSYTPAILSEAVLHIYRVRMDDAKLYTCTATNEAGTDRKYVNVQVKPKRGDIGAHEIDEPSYPTTSRPYPPYYPTERPGQGNLQPYKVGVGDTAKLNCEIEGSDARTIWDRIDGRPLPYGATFSGNNLVIDNIRFDAAGLYECSVIDRYGKKPLVTAEIVVVPIPRIIFAPPMPMVVRSGENVVILCNATGEEPIRVQWHAENHRLLPPSVIADRQYLRFNHITPADAGRYYCSAVNRHGNATKVAEVLVNRGTAVNRPPNSRVHEVFEGDSVALDCDIPAERIQPGIRFNWRRRENQISPSADYEHNRLILRNIHRNDEGRYICEIIAPNGVVASNYVDVIVKRPEIINKRICRENDFKCISHPHTCIPSSLVCDGIYDCTDHSDELNCQQFKRWKKDHQSNKVIATATIRDYPVLKLDPPQSYLRVGETTEVECLTSDDDFTDIIWERADGRPLPPNFKQIRNRLIIMNAQHSDSGDYVCKCSTDEGQIYTSNYELNIENDVYKHQTQQPKVEHAEIGATVILKCDTDQHPGTYLWNRQHGQFSPGQDISNPELRLVDVQTKDAGNYICTSSYNGKTVDSLTTLIVTGAIPYFPQAPNSYMVFPQLQNAYSKFNFEITFRPERPDGLILYNGQKKGSGDYISLILNDRHPEFRFDFGNKPTIIRSEEPIELKQWHTVKVNRARKEGFMIVDNQRPVSFPSVTQFIGLDLIENLYLGGIPKWDHIPITAIANNDGFVGCVSRLIIKDKTIELFKDALFKEGTTSCEPCADEPCQNDGICLESQTEYGYSCICKEGYTGRNCSIEGFSCTPGICGSGRCEDSDIGMECYCPLNKTGDRCQYIEHLNEKNLGFNDGSYACYRTPKASKLNIKFNMRPDNLQDSVVLYVAESEKAHGDFIAVVIKDKYLELRLNTGARIKPLIVRSQNQIKLDKWIEVQISRKQGESYLKVGDEPQLSAKASGPARSMYLKTNLYIGGYDKRIVLNKGVDVTHGFSGCISRLEESSQAIDLVSDIIDAANIHNCRDSNEIYKQSTESYDNEYNGETCARDPCENGGTCFEDENGFTCYCMLGFAGNFCELNSRLDLTANFRGNGYLELDNIAFSNTSEQLESFVAILFSTNYENGLLLWYGQENGIPYNGQDFMALGIVDGLLEFAFRLDGEESSIKSLHTQVNDGQRHVAIIKRNGNQASLELDHLTNYGESRPTMKKHMHLSGHLFIGGVPDMKSFTGNRYTQGFNGCVRVVEAQDGGPINLGLRAISAVNVDTCPEENDSDMDLGSEPPVV